MAAKYWSRESELHGWSASDSHETSNSNNLYLMKCFFHRQVTWGFMFQTLGLLPVRDKDNIPIEHRNGEHFT